MTTHSHRVGDKVIIGKGAQIWKIVGFFGELGDIAELQRVDLPSSNTSARFDRLTRVPS